MTEGIEISPEQSRWRSRDLKFISGNLSRVLDEIPEFAFGEFRSDPEEPENPYLQTIVRQPQTKFERPIPVAVVSMKYVLIQHREIAEHCVDVLRKLELPVDKMKAELGLTELGELMVFRLYLPDEYDFKGADKYPMKLRVECVNSVDGSYRLVVLFGWLRFVCLNGLVVGKTLTEIRETHAREIDFEKVRNGLISGFKEAKKASGLLARLEMTSVDLDSVAFKSWINTAVSNDWGVKAAVRAYHISRTGLDVSLPKPFAPGKPTEKPFKSEKPIPGAATPAKNLYDVLQALTWIASQTTNFEQRSARQATVESLISDLATRST